MVAYMKYESKDLKESFSQLANLKDSTLIPILDVVADKFIETLRKEPLLYGISDMKLKPRYYFHNPHSEYELVVGGKLVEMNIIQTNIDVVDESEMWWMVGYVEFEGDNSAIILDAFKSFVKQFDLEELKKEAKDGLHSGKTYHLDGQMCSYYR